MTPTHTMPIGAVAAPRGTPRWMRGAIVGAAVITVGAAALVLLNRPPATAALVQPVQVTRSAGVQESPYITSDGKGVAYRILGPGDTASRVELRRGSDGSAVALAEAGAPRGWSPDGDKSPDRDPARAGDRPRARRDQHRCWSLVLSTGPGHRTGSAWSMSAATRSCSAPTMARPRCSRGRSTRIRWPGRRTAGGSSMSRTIPGIWTAGTSQSPRSGWCRRPAAPRSSSPPAMRWT